MTDDEKKSLVMIRCAQKTDPRMVYQQDPNIRIFISNEITKTLKLTFKNMQNV